VHHKEIFFFPPPPPRKLLFIFLAVPLSFVELSLQSLPPFFPPNLLLAVDLYPAHPAPFLRNVAPQQVLWLLSRLCRAEPSCTSANLVPVDFFFFFPYFFFLPDVRVAFCKPFPLRSVENSFFFFCFPPSQVFFRRPSLLTSASPAFVFFVYSFCFCCFCLSGTAQGKTYVLLFALVNPATGGRFHGLLWRPPFACIPSKLGGARAKDSLRGLRSPFYPSSLPTHVHQSTDPPQLPQCSPYLSPAFPPDSISCSWNRLLQLCYK